MGVHHEPSHHPDHVYHHHHPTPPNHGQHSPDHHQIMCSMAVSTILVLVLVGVEVRVVVRGGGLAGGGTLVESDGGCDVGGRRVRANNAYFPARNAKFINIHRTRNSSQTHHPNFPQLPPSTRWQHQNRPGHTGSA